MNDLERDLRTLLEAKAEEARVATSPGRRVLRRARRRQVVTALGVSVAFVGAIAVGILAIGSLWRSERLTPALPPTTTQTLNGLQITFPRTWHLIDPDAAGLNGPQPTPDLPKLVLALSPQEPGDLLACPGMVEGTAPTFVMTVQEQPLALAGSSSTPWPVELEPIGTDTSEVACYPDWELLRAGWTAAGRTFEARVGFAPDVTDEDRAALLAAFDSMTFDERAEPAASVVLATGTAGGEDWQLIAARQEDGLVLSLNAESFSTGVGGFDPTTDEFQLTDHVFGTGSDRERVIFGAVPEDVVRVEAYPALDPVRLTDRVEVEVIDVPSAIAPNLNAFVLVVQGDAPQTLNAYDAAGGVVLRGGVGTDGEPVGTPPTSLPPEVLAEHGGTYWGVYLAVGDRPGAPELQVAFERARAGGYSPSIGDIACDQDAASQLGVDPGAARVAIYFATRRDAELTAERVAFDLDLAPVGVARVTTYCLD